MAGAKGGAGTKGGAGAKVVLVTGASSGIGLAAALALVRTGHRVWGGARRTAAMAPLAAAGGRAVALDVTDDASMVAAVEAVLAAEGRIDALVNNAGYGGYGAVEEVPIAEARRQVETNLVGLGRMTQLVLPGMRERGSGRIVNVSSVGGTIWTPLGSWYHATKWAVEGFTHALRLEVAPFGIDAVIVAPGSIRTDWNAIAATSARETSGHGPYASLASGFGRLVENPRLGSPPEAVARAIAAAVEARRPRTIYRVGQGARTLPAARRLLPDRAMDWLMRRATR